MICDVQLHVAYHSTLCGLYNTIVVMIRRIGVFLLPFDQLHNGTHPQRWVVPGFIGAHQKLCCFGKPVVERGTDMPGASDQVVFVAYLVLPRNLMQKLSAFIQLYEGAEFLHQISWQYKIRHEYHLVRGARHVGPSLNDRFTEAAQFLVRSYEPWDDPPLRVRAVMKLIERQKKNADAPDHYNDGVVQPAEG